MRELRVIDMEILRREIVIKRITALSAFNQRIYMDVDILPFSPLQQMINGLVLFSFPVRRITFSLVISLGAQRVNSSGLKGKDLAWAGMGGELCSQNISIHFSL